MTTLEIEDGLLTINTTNDEFIFNYDRMGNNVKVVRIQTRKTELLGKIKELIKEYLKDEMCAPKK